MTLQELLLKLSYNKDYRVETGCYDGVCKITITEYWYHIEELKRDVSLSPGEIDLETLSAFEPFLKN